MNTSLNLLTRDGAVYVAFSPALTAAQYAELLQLVKQPGSDEDLRQALQAWARVNGLSVNFSEIATSDSRDE